MNPYLIAAIVAALVLGVVFSDRIKTLLGFLWFVTFGVWGEVFKGGSSTGNGAGAMGTLVCMAIILVQLALLVVAGICALIWYI